MWNPVKASASGPAFSHLFFADDLLLFAKANESNCRCVKEVVDEFCMLSGQKVNNLKSKVFFSPNIDRDRRVDLCNILGFSSTSNLGSYLGFPLRHAGSSNQDFNFILDRVQLKLAGWKANLLSLAGRRVLIQATTSTIPSYVMQTSFLPVRILDSLDRMNMNFLWGSSETNKKMHWVGWPKVTRPKEEGGLSIHLAKERNLAFLAKLNWRFNTEKDTLRAHVLQKKYLTPRRMNSRNVTSLPSSRVWKSMKKGEVIFSKGTRWSLGRDSRLNFWTDSWTSNGPLRSTIHGPLTGGKLILFLETSP